MRNAYPCQSDAILMSRTPLEVTLSTIASKTHAPTIHEIRIGRAQILLSSLGVIEANSDIDRKSLLPNRGWFEAASRREAKPRQEARQIRNQGLVPAVIWAMVAAAQESWWQTSALALGQRVAHGPLVAAGPNNKPEVVTSGF